MPNKSAQDVPAFGTSGLRGLAVALTPDLTGSYVRAFVQTCTMGQGVLVGRDLRASSPGIADDIIAAISQAGLAVYDCGAVPTPALALAGAAGDYAAIMVTGSHIPADRNGLKFYTTGGVEITKTDEAAILAARKSAEASVDLRAEGPVASMDVAGPYLARYRDAFGPDALAGSKIGLWVQSSVGMPLLGKILTALGAEVTELAPSDTFVAVDTEAVDDTLRQQLADWSADFDAIVSLDGDGDRPLLADGHGRVIPGDILGQITGQMLDARTIVTPISSNTGAEALFEQVLRTRIGSPHVIAAMEGQTDVLGYEANGGVLLGYDAQGPKGSLAPLVTRDGALPLIATLYAAKGDVAALVSDQPQRFTAADRLQDVPRHVSQELIAGWPRAAGMQIDETDGLRLTQANGDIVHLRPSGNAPELRIYTEAGTAKAAQSLLHEVKTKVTNSL